MAENTNSKTSINNGSDKISNLDLVAQLASKSLKHRPSVESILEEEADSVKTIPLANQPTRRTKKTKIAAKKNMLKETATHQEDDLLSNISNVIQVKKNKALNGKVHVRIHARLANILKQHILHGGSYLSPIIELIIIDFCKRNLPQSKKEIEYYIKNFINQKDSKSK